MTIPTPMLERYLFSHTRALEREYDHVTRRQRQAALASLLCLAFDEFHQMTLCRTCSQSDMTYLDAERMADTFGGIFGMDVPPEAFLPSEEYADKSISHYRKYQEYRSMMASFDLDGGDLDSFCRQVEYAPWKVGLSLFRVFNSMGYVYSMRTVFDCLCGSIPYERLREFLVIFDPPRVRPMSDPEVRCFARTMFRVVRELEEIVSKRRNRKSLRR